jgi:hypothetical protein
VRVETSTPLRRAGLERALARAGLTVAPNESSASIVLRTSDDPPAEAPIELSVSGAGVLLRVGAEVDPDTWAALGRVVQELMATTQAGPTV